MECIPREDAAPYIQWVYSVFGSCVYGYRDLLSTLLGCASIFCWVQAQVPQIVENHKLRSADGLSLYLLYFWLAGDMGNMFSCVLNHQLPFQIFLATYFVFTDLILLTQYFHFGNGPDLCSENALKVNTTYDQLNDDEETRLLFNATSDLDMVQTTDSSSVDNYGSTNSNSNAKTFFMGLLMFGFKLSSTSLTSTSVTAEADIAPVSFGLMLAWTCTVFYLMSRFPQIYKNYKRGSTQGLSLALFAFAVSGNITYASSILVHPGHTKQTLKDALPYLGGSIGILFLDAIIFGQFIYYRNKNHSRTSTDATTTSLNRVLTHQ